MLGNLSKMAPATLQKIRDTITGKETQDDSLITEVTQSDATYRFPELFFWATRDNLFMPETHHMYARLKKKPLCRG